MSWTPNAPTEAGPYYWKRTEEDEPLVLEVYQGSCVLMAQSWKIHHAVEDLGGLWCRLVPEEPAKPCQYIAVVEHLLNHCKDAECETCSQIVCDYADPMHFHHDGCPSCCGYPSPVDGAISWWKKEHAARVAERDDLKMKVEDLQNSVVTLKQRLAVEVEKAFMEAVLLATRYHDSPVDNLWNRSRAKRVSSGEEQ